MYSTNKTPKGKERAEEILDAATHILVTEGHAGFSMRRVADQIGSRLSHVQYYFGGPAELVQALFERVIQSAISAFEQRAAGDNLMEAARFILHELEDRDACQMFWELWALAGRSRDIDAVLKRFYGSYCEHIEETLGRFNPQLTAMECRNRSIIIVSMLEGLSLFRGADGRLDTSLSALDEEILLAVARIAGGEGREDATA